MWKEPQAGFRARSFPLNTVKLASYVMLIIFMLSMSTMVKASESHSGVLLIDPGHSPRSPGATSCTGIPEYLYNNNLADTVVATLKQQHVPVITTRQSKENISLQDRALAAKGKKLLLSLHHDSVQPQFVNWSNKGRPSSAKAQGYSIFISRKNKYYSKSLLFARKLGAALHQRGLVPTLHHAEKIPGENRQLIDPKLGIYLYDNLHVLMNSDAPAVLLEAAVIVNPRDEALAASIKYQRKIAESVAEMVGK